MINLLSVFLYALKIQFYYMSYVSFMSHVSYLSYVSYMSYIIS